MGNSSSSLPYTIGSETHPTSTHEHSNGWSLHEGSRKSDSEAVTVFKASKPTLAKTSLIGSSRRNNNNNVDPTLTQILPALHHFNKIKRLVHPRLLKVHATLDTDYPNGDGPSGGTVSDAVNPASLSALESTATTGDLLIITEPVIPLLEYLDGLIDMLQRNERSDHPKATSVEDRIRNQISWGLYNIIEALDFLHTTAKLSHGCLSPYSIYVSRSSDFYLSSFSICTPIGIDDKGDHFGPTPHFRHYEAYVCPSEYRSAERVEERWEVIRTSGVHAMDSYSLGVLIDFMYRRVFNSVDNPIPLKLRKALSRLRTDNVRMRPRVKMLTKCPVFDNDYVKTRLMLEDMDTMTGGVEERILFWQGLVDLMNRGVLDEGCWVYKVLPVLVRCVENCCKGGSAGDKAGGILQDVHRREVLAAIPPLFQIAETHLTSNKTHPTLTFSTTMTPIIQSLFQINDRGVRGALLSRITPLSTHLPPPTLNSTVFEPMCSGFTDSSAPLRELTLKSTVVLVPHLTPSNLEKLVRYLIRLQSDPESSIRTNTVIFIGKIAPDLTSDVSRSKLVLPAFTRAMKDEFTPCRMAALRAVGTCKEYFDGGEIARSVLPGVVPHLMDKDGDVRREAFRVVDLLLGGLREESDRLSLEERRRVEETGEVLVQGATNALITNGGIGELKSQPNKSPSSGGYLSGFSSWVKSTTKLDATTTASAMSSAPMSNTVNADTAATATATATTGTSTQTQQPIQKPSFASLSLSDANIGGGGGGGGGGADSGNGWDDDDDDDFLNNDDHGHNLAQTTTTTTSAQSKPQSSWSNNNNEDDFLAAFNTKPPTIKSPSSSTLKMGALGSGKKLVMPSKTLGGTNKGKKTIAEKKAEFAARKAEREKQKMVKSNTVIKKVETVDDGWDDF